MVAPPLRIAFFGTPGFAVPTLDALLASRHPVVGVVTQPDRPRGRGQRTAPAAVKTRALAAGVPILQPDRLKDPEFAAAFAALRPDLGVVAAYGKILPQSLIAAPRLGMINVHASLLPRYRGAAPVQRAIIAGEPETGVTIMRVVHALDAGPMLARTVRPIAPDETSAEVEHDLARIGAALLARVVERLAAGPVEETAQDDTAATYAPRLTKEDGIVDWRQSAAAIHNRIRGLHPWPHAHASLDGRRYILLRTQPGSPHTTAAPGTIVAAAGDRLEVATGAGTVRLVEIQPEGKRPLTAREFLAGHHVAAGAAFS
jgi:methionyl-tRNA formyltransferase